MRLWSRRRQSGRAPAVFEPLAVDDLLLSAADGVLVVGDRRIREGGAVFRGRLLMEPTRALDVLTARLRPFGLTPFLRDEDGETVLQALALVDAPVPQRARLNVVLFVLTCASTLFAGTFFTGSPTFDAFRAASVPGFFLSGVPFAATLLTILAVHEFGHYFTARHYRASVSLPYFIPAPPPLFLFGTLGAIIRMRSPVRDRNSLFDIAAAGPLAGLAVALPAIVLGLAWSRLAPAPPGGLLTFGDSLLLRWLSQLRFGPIPAGMMVYTHPVADAAWVGFLVTALNLFPVGQLDGGRIAYALFGRHHRTVGIATVIGLVVMGVVTRSVNWFVWAGLIVFLVGFRHSPPLDDLTPLSRGRYVVGVACLVLLVLLVPPIPIEFG